MKLKKILNRMVEEGSLIHKEAKPKAEEELAERFLTFNFSPLTSALYALPPHRIFLSKSVDRKHESLKKIKKVSSYIETLSFFPQIRLVGLSGAVAMRNASKDDDVDLFIITEGGRLWTARLISILVAEMMGLRRRRKAKKFKDKVCLNLFFDEKELSIPSAKRNLYVAHEVLQMSPLINKDGVYERFLKANGWVFDLFPNAKNPKKTVGKSGATEADNILGNLVEELVKKAQLFLIERHRTTEIITQNQLWFFPRDFEKILKKEKII